MPTGQRARVMPMQRKSAVETAPRPDRYLAVWMLRNIDRGGPLIRKEPLDQFILDHGWAATVWVVCTQFWFIAGGAFGLLNAASDSLAGQYDNRLITDVSRSIFILTIGCLTMGVIRCAGMMRLIRRFRRTNPPRSDVT
jgi:hypothetical protein